MSGTDDLRESVVSEIDPSRIAWTNASMHTTNDLLWTDVVALLRCGAVVIANVLHGHHFVLVVGVDDELSGEKWDNAFQRLRAVCAVPCCCAWLALYVERRIQVRQKKPPPTPRFARLLLSKWKHGCASCGAHCCDCK